jgi:pimeloyl-ACP methyl ester carboxylesterase
MERPMPEIPDVPVEHDWVEAGGLRMHVATAGDPEAEPLVLLHGWPQHWYAWRRLIGPLSERYRVIAPDLRGFGWTDAPSGSYEKRVLASDVVALLDALDLDRVRLAGHDWGGFVGFLLCLEHPERVSHFAVAGMSHPWVQPERGVGGAVKQVRRLSYMALLSSPVVGRQVMQRAPGFVRTVLRASSVDAERTWSEAERESYVAQWSEPDRAAATVGVYRSFLTKEIRELASGGFRDATMQQPAVLFCGVADPVIRPDALGGYERNAPNMRIEVVEDAGHWVPEEAPDVMLEGMLELYARPA